MKRMLFRDRLQIVLCLFAFLSHHPSIYPQTSGTRRFTDIKQENLRNRVQEQIVPARMLRLQTTSVPNFIGRVYNRDQIVPELEKLRLVLGNIVEEVDNTRSGQIIQQDPVADSRVLIGTKVNLVLAVSLPVEPVQKIAVPGVIGFDLGQARQIIIASGLQAGEVTEIPTGQPPGLVMRQFPGEGKMVDPGSSVHLYVSLGQSSMQVTVPDLVGQSLDNAAILLERNNLRVGSLVEEFADAPEGIIRSQFPPPATLVDPGTPVDIVYSKNYRIPDVIGRTLDEARKILDYSGFRIGKISERKSKGEPGIVLDQSPPAGTIIRQPTEVELILSVPYNALPAWIFWGTGAIIILAVGGAINRRINKRNSKTGNPDSKYELKLIPDSGVQQIVNTGHEVLPPDISFNLVPDKGKQNIEP